MQSRGIHAHPCALPYALTDCHRYYILQMFYSTIPKEGADDPEEQSDVEQVVDEEGSSISDL